jgi:murein L,D-transpeptidase YcbB/YkuD
VFRNSLLKRAVAVASIALGAVPASAQWAEPVPWGSPPVAPWTQSAPIPVSGAVARFYESRGNQPIWFRDGPRSDAATQLLAVLHRSPIDGFHDGPRLAAALQQIIREAPLGGPPSLLQADRMLSTVWVRYVQAMRSPSRGVLYATDELARPTAVNAVLSEAAAARSLAWHLRAVSDVNPVYAQMRDAAWDLAQLTGGVADQRITANLERARAFPSSGRFVVVDVVSQRLFMFEDGHVRDSMRVIVGKRATPTPMIASVIHYSTVNPYWNVPDDLVQSLIAPNVLKQGAAYLNERGYEIVLNWAEDAPRLSPTSINWQAVAAGRERIRVRQKPSPANSMGNYKFAFANGLGIYLHDTPNKAPFADANRWISNGCVRLEDASRFARWLHGRVPGSDTSAPEQHVKVDKGVPIFLTYLSVRSDGARLTYLDDPYGLDDGRSAFAAR